ncbi:hypothetical protein KL925_000084 [Ogataea polymorpha]|nr:hypothetical protein KL925_000084 [Ogataea polymorpha]
MEKNETAACIQARSEFAVSGAVSRGAFRLDCLKWQLKREMRLQGQRLPEHAVEFFQEPGNIDVQLHLLIAAGT